VFVQHTGFEEIPIRVHCDGKDGKKMEKRWKKMEKDGGGNESIDRLVVPRFNRNSKSCTDIEKHIRCARFADTNWRRT
jgi:hypothetical protein